MRTIHHFNHDWYFAPEQTSEGFGDSRFESVTLPHSNKTFETRYVDNEEYQFVSTYYKTFVIEDDLSNKRVFIDFDGVLLSSTVYLNGQLLGEHRGGYTPFSYEITDILTTGENRLVVYVDATESPDIPPFGGRVDYLTFGGIYRDVYLRIVEQNYMERAFVRTLDVLSAPSLECDIFLSDLVAGASIQATLEDSEGEQIHIIRQEVGADEQKVTVGLSDFGDIELWSLHHPALYNLRLQLFLNDELIDELVEQFGFRQAEFSKDGNFYLNGEAIKLIGLNRHQTYPFIGAAAPARLQALDADIVKYELGCNIVRTSHYPQSPHFLRRCDEIGLLVLEEIPGWQHLGDVEWQRLSLRDLKAMIQRDYNHPSIILWGVRINESPDDDDLYMLTNSIAHELDPTRQTGGIRNFADSNFLEDVFTLNDFTDGIQTPRVPHLITEFGGHMYPTKTFDNEERRIEQAFIHVRKQNLQMGHPDVAGAIGWCAFDYHTHKEFGSGDRICHHGVMDIFRLPKYAAYFYRSQKSPEDEVVLYAATSWTHGDRAGGGNNPLTIFSNCDAIEIYLDNVLYGRFEPDDDQYPHLPHPPFVIRWSEPYNAWGMASKELKLLGYIQNEVVCEQVIAGDHVPDKLKISTHTDKIVADGADMAQISLQVVDKYGNVLPYQAKVVEWSLEGEAELVGENPMALLGGQGACYLRAGFEAGQVTVSAKTNGLPPASLMIEIVNE